MATCSVHGNAPLRPIARRNRKFESGRGGPRRIRAGSRISLASPVPMDGCLRAVEDMSAGKYSEAGRFRAGVGESLHTRKPNVKRHLPSGQSPGATGAGGDTLACRVRRAGIGGVRGRRRRVAVGASFRGGARIRMTAIAIARRGSDGGRGPRFAPPHVPSAYAVTSCRHRYASAVTVSPDLSRMPFGLVSMGHRAQWRRLPGPGGAWRAPIAGGIPA